MKISLPCVRFIGLVGLMVICAVPSPGFVSISQDLPVSASIPDQGQKSQTFEDRVEKDVDHALAEVQPLLDRYGYLAIFLAVLVEGVGLVAPGQMLLIAGAYTAARGGLNLGWVLFWAASAAVLGNSLGYFLGRWGGRPVLHKIGVNEARLHRLEGYFARHGRGVVIVARFVDGLRQLNGIVAGLLQMPWRVFTTCNLLGSALWTGVWGLGTYFLARKVVSLHLTFRQVEPWLAGLFFLGFLALLVYLNRPDRRPTS